MNCLFCCHGITHAWHDDGEFNESHAFDGWAPTQDSADPEPQASPELVELFSRPSQIPAKREGDPRFLALLDDIEALHASKQRDYGRDADPFANVRASEEWGVSPWIGALIRATDKVRRLQTFAIKGSLSNEGVEDSLMDLAVYALIALILFREED